MCTLRTFDESMSGTSRTNNNISDRLKKTVLYKEIPESTNAVKSEKENPVKK